jgi:transcriptional regulator with XRE-family HTH domain
MLFITPSYILEKLPALLREKRILKEMTQNELGARAHVSVAVVRKFEQTGQISLESFIKLAYVLDIAEPLFLSIQNSMKKSKTIDEVMANNEARNTKIRKRVRK